MASDRHDFIVSMIARKIRIYGFEIIYLDGRYNNIATKKFEIPPKIIHHKPDIIGEKDRSIFCIGEAKTTNDLLSARTANQIVDFLDFVSVCPLNRFILGIPAGAIEQLNSLLEKLKLKNRDQIEILYIPEVLLPNDEEI